MRYAYRAEAMPIGRHLWGKRRVERRGEHLHAYRADEHRIIAMRRPAASRVGQPPARKFDVFVSL